MTVRYTRSAPHYVYLVLANCLPNCLHRSWYNPPQVFHVSRVWHFGSFKRTSAPASLPPRHPKPNTSFQVHNLKPYSQIMEFALLKSKLCTYLSARSLDHPEHGRTDPFCTLRTPRIQKLRVSFPRIFLGTRHVYR